MRERRQVWKKFLKRSKPKNHAHQSEIDWVSPETYKFLTTKILNLIIKGYILYHLSKILSPFNKGLKERYAASEITLRSELLTAVINVCFYHGFTGGLVLRASRVNIYNLNYIHLIFFVLQEYNH